MNQRYVIIPPLATIVGNVRNDAKGTTARQEVQLPFEQIMLDVWSIHPSFGKGLASIDASIRIRAAFRGGRPGEVVTLDEDAWTRLAAVVKSEDSGLLAEIAIPLRESSPAYFDCILDASSTHPAARAKS